ncbi:hypothetical protein Tco_0706350 [Tanacetum coccineum]|uniref:Homologous recombination OB-fold protein OB-fold domain-containing protein n=1 Tax=Tanacetum coccineum TaxID=301880 RepID=A0ABQ4Y748_9ASTR
MSSNPNYQREDLLDIDDYDLPLTPVPRPCNRHVRDTITITSTQNIDGIVQVEETLVSIRPGHAGRDDSVLSTQEYMKQVVEDMGEDEDFNSGLWVGATEYVKANGGISKFSQNALYDLKVTVKYLSCTLADSIHYKVINEEGYGKEITIGSAIILTDVLVFCSNPSMHCLNITKKNVVKVFHKDFVPGNGSGVGGSGMLMEEEEIFDEEALDIVLEEETRESRAHEEWLEKYRQQEEEDAKHERQLLGFHGTI